jgi:hypothetical protein
MSTPTQMMDIDSPNIIPITGLPFENNDGITMIIMPTEDMEDTIPGIIDDWPAIFSNGIVGSDIPSGADPDDKEEE